jgi:hypothetical protein
MPTDRNAELAEIIRTEGTDRVTAAIILDARERAAERAANDLAPEPVIAPTLARYADQTVCSIGDTVAHNLAEGTGVVIATHAPRRADGADHGQATVRWDSGELTGEHGHGCYYLRLVKAGGFEVERGRRGW